MALLRSNGLGDTTYHCLARARWHRGPEHISHKTVAGRSRQWVQQRPERDPVCIRKLPAHKCAFDLESIVSKPPLGVSLLATVMLTGSQHDSVQPGDQRAQHVRPASQVGHVCAEYLDSATQCRCARASHSIVRGRREEPSGFRYERSKKAIFWIAVVSE